VKKKTIIVVSGKGNVGKSMTLSRLGHQLYYAGASTTQKFPAKDFRAYFQYKTKKIGIQTYGDTEHLAYTGLYELQSLNCDIIAIASKGFGKTVKAIEAFANSNNYRVIWTAPYRVWDGSITTSDIKDYTASHLKLMIDDVISGTL
jgi:hypothetical protein